MSEVTGVDHLIIAVRDLAEAERNYTGIFGRAPSWRGTHPGAGTANVLYRLENTYVELFSPVGEGAYADGLKKHLDSKGEGLFGMVFGVADADAARAAFASRGLNPSSPVPGSGKDEITGAAREWRNIFIPETDVDGLFLFCIQHLSPVDALPSAPLSEGAADGEAVLSCDHIVISTHDSEMSKSLFGDKFGIRLALDQNKPEWGVRQLFFRTGGMTVEVVEPLDPSRAPKSQQYWGLAWKVGNIAATVHRLSAAGFDVSEVRKGRKPGTAVATIRNQTHGVPTILMGTWEPEAA